MSSSMNKKEEGSRGAPIPDRWYTLSLGSSFKDHQPSSKFCTLRYEFKPASVDKTQPGTLHKSKDNKISVEFHNNQHGKPKVTFEGSSEDYKENDAVLFFDGQSFRLERLHRAFKRLRHVRLPGESSSSAVLPTSSAAAPDTGSPPLAKAPKAQPPPPPPPQSQGFNSRNSFSAPPPPPPPLRGPVSVEVERIDIGDGGNSGGKSKIEKSISTPPQQSNSMASPDLNDFDLEEHLDIMIDEDDDALGPSKDNAEEKAAHTGIDINMPQQNDTDDEIADVDVNDDNGVNGSTAAAALRAQVNAVERKEATSSSSTSSGSESSGSSSGSGSGSSRSSSDSESSDGDSVNSI